MVENKLGPVSESDSDYPYSPLIYYHTPSINLSKFPYINFLNNKDLIRSLYMPSNLQF